MKKLLNVMSVLALVVGTSAAYGDAAPPFNRSAAVAAIGVVDVKECRASGQSHVTVTFNPDGSVPAAVVDSGALVGTPEADCISAKFKAVKIPAFTGPQVRIGRSLNL